MQCRIGWRATLAAGAFSLVKERQRFLGREAIFLIAEFVMNHNGAMLAQNGIDLVPAQAAHHVAHFVPVALAGMMECLSRRQANQFFGEEGGQQLGWVELQEFLIA